VKIWCSRTNKPRNSEKTESAPSTQKTYKRQAAAWHLFPGESVPGRKRDPAECTPRQAGRNQAVYSLRQALQQAGRRQGRTQNAVQ